MRKQIVSSGGHWSDVYLGFGCGRDTARSGGQREGCWGGAERVRVSSPFHGCVAEAPDLQRQVVREWGAVARSRTGCSYYTIQDIGQSSTECWVSWICQSALHTKNGIILTFMFYGNMVVGERLEHVQIHSSQCPRAPSKLLQKNGQAPHLCWASIYRFICTVWADKLYSWRAAGLSCKNVSSLLNGLLFFVTDSCGGNLVLGVAFRQRWVAPCEKHSGDCTECYKLLLWL